MSYLLTQHISSCQVASAEFVSDFGHLCPFARTQSSSSDEMRCELGGGDGVGLEGPLCLQIVNFVVELRKQGFQVLKLIDTIAAEREEVGDHGSLQGIASCMGNQCKPVMPDIETLLN